MRACCVRWCCALQVDVHPQFRDTKCFFVRSAGAPDWVDFSYLKCLTARFGDVMGPPLAGGAPRQAGPGGRRF